MCFFLSQPCYLNEELLGTASSTSSSCETLRVPTVEITGIVSSLRRLRACNVCISAKRCGWMRYQAELELGTLHLTNHYHDRFATRVISSELFKQSNLNVCKQCIPSIQGSNSTVGYYEWSPKYMCLMSLQWIKPFLLRIICSCLKPSVLAPSPGPDVRLFPRSASGFASADFLPCSTSRVSGLGERVSRAVAPCNFHNNIAHRCQVKFEKSPNCFPKHTAKV